MKCLFKSMLCFLSIFILMIGQTIGGSSAFAACSHPRDYVVQVEVPGFINYTDSNYHYAYYSIKSICGYCGETVDKKEGGYKAFSHQYGNVSTCSVCGYTKKQSCSHTNTKLVLRDNFYNYISTSKHEKGSVYQKVCTSCGKVVQDNLNDSVLESHTFSGNTCTKCYYTKASCSHSRQYSVATKNYDPISGNNNQHTVDTYEYWYCPDCQKITRPQEHTKTEKANHFFSGNKCTVCGYTKSSSNSSGHECQWSTDTRTVTYQSNTSQHWEYVTISCHICGENMYYNNDNATRKNHTFSGNKCTICGYVKSETAQSSNDKNFTSTTTQVKQRLDKILSGSLTYNSVTVMKENSTFVGANARYWDFGYAKNVLEMCFGVELNNPPFSPETDNMKLVCEARGMDELVVSFVLGNARPGDFIQLYTLDFDSTKSAIIYSADDTGVKLIEVTGDKKVMKTTYTWKRLVDDYYALSYYIADPYRLK